MAGTGPTRRDLPFSRQRLDPRAVEVVRRLQEAGFETYFVGGCVRDLVLDREPKDFDVATAARPEQVRRLFRRSRIIGRRFQLVHVYGGRAVYEVSTFRCEPEEARGAARLIRNDNTFGTAQSDALRRDFSVNALFLDPLAGAIVDWVGGLEDLRERRLRSIGDPARRFREDPVRILRLVKFLRRLGLEPGSAEILAAYRFAPYLVEAAPPRVVEELFRLLATGDMEGVLEDLLALRALRLVLPDLAPWLEARPERLERLRARLRSLDAYVREGAEPTYGLRLAFLYGLRVEEELDPRRRTLAVRDPAQVPVALLAALQRRGRLARAIVARAGRILLAQSRLEQGPGRRPDEAARLADHDWFPDALEYFRCRVEAAGGDLGLHDEWHELALSLERDQR